MAEPPQNTRREFLAGQSARDALGAILDKALPAVPASTNRGAASRASTDPQATPDAGGAEYLLKFSRAAMACQFEFLLPAGRFANDAETALAALDLVDALEEQLTVYRHASEVMSINRLAAQGPVPVESRLFDLLTTAQSLSEQTEGAYDITTGPLTKIWGFYRRQGQVPSAEEIADALLKVGSRHVELDAQRRTVRFRRSGVELNLGSIGKGYALDRAAELFRAAGIDRALLHGGQSSVVALAGADAETGGAAPPEQSDLNRIPPSGQPWMIGVGDPLRPGRRLALVKLANRALGTSGSSMQFFRHAGKRYAHILDPRSGWPAEGLLSATVIAPTAALADACSTACYVLGLEGALKLCQRLGLAGLFVELPEGGGRPRLHRCGLSADECQGVDEETEFVG